MKRHSSAFLLLLIGCAAPPTLELATVQESSELTASDSSSSFAKSISDADKTLSALYARELEMRGASRELQRHLDQANFYIDDAVNARVHEIYLNAVKKVSAAHHAKVEAKIEVARLKNKVAHAAVRTAEPKFLAAKLAFEKELATARVTAQKSLEAPNASAVLALRVACYDYHASIVAQLPTIRTNVKSLRNRKDLGGDIALDGLLLSACLAIASEETQTATKMGALQTPLAALSSRQMRRFERRLVNQIEGVTLRSAPKNIANAQLFADRFNQIAAVFVVLVADQTRHFTNYEKPGLTWLSKNSKKLSAYASIDGSILERTGFFVYDHRRNAIIALSSKAQIAPANTKIFRGKAGSKYFKWANERGGETVNQLPAFIGSLGLACNAIDFVPAGASKEVASGFTCDHGCDAGMTASPKKKSGWGLVGFTSPAGTAPANRATTAACSSGVGSGGAAPGGSDPQSDGRGSIGGLMGGSTRCSLASLVGSRTADRINGCIATSYPGSRGISTPLGDAPRGTSCRPGVSTQYDEPHEFPQDDGSTDVVTIYDTNGDGKPDITLMENDNGTPADPSDDMSTVSCPTCVDFPVDPNESVEEATDRFLADDNGAAQTPPDEPAPAAPATPPGELPPPEATVPETEKKVTGDIWDEEWEMINAQDTLDGQCVENPTCRDPDDQADATTDGSSMESCTGDDASCSNSCTSNDARTEPFTSCMDAATSTTTSAPQAGDPYTNPAPDAANGYVPSQVAALAACSGGGVPARDQCRGEGLALCASDSPNCVCGGARSVELPAGLIGPSCESMMCSNAASSERSVGVNSSRMSSGASACGCGSVFGGN